METTYRCFTAVCLSLAAFSLYTANAYAQEGQPSPQPQDGGHPAIVVAPGDIPWHSFEWVERRYKIEAMHFKARDESGIDWWGSDEVMIETVDAKGWTVSDEFGDVDSGETHKLIPTKSCIVAVRPGTVVLGKTSVCDDVGEPAPLWFDVEFWEKDLIGIPIGFCVRVSPGPNGHKGSRDCANDGNGDDFLGRARIDLTQQDLEAVLPNVGDEHTETVVLDPCPGAQCAGFPDYSFTYRITRFPDVKVGLHGVLEEAMQKIGARSELEAIIAGLRALRAQSPRKIEPETGAMPDER